MQNMDKKIGLRADRATTRDCPYCVYPAYSPDYMRTSLLTSSYFAPIQWYQKLYRSEISLIEQHDHFVKQTYRNRCIIATTQGTQALTVPIERTDGEKCAMKDMRISDHGNWRHLHWNALLSAYGESPFFEYLADDIHPFFEKRWEWLYDFNWEITEKMCELLDIAPRMERTDHYMTTEELEAINANLSTDNQEGINAKSQAESVIDINKKNQAGGLSRIIDFREVIRPKHPQPDPDFVPSRYYQVYEQKHGFQPNLSILDLIFNMGREAVLWL